MPTIRKFSPVRIATSTAFFSGKFCPSGYSVSNVTNTCYKQYTSVASWDTARSQCQKAGGDLVSMATRKKFDEFRNIVQTAAGNIHVVH